MEVVVVAVSNVEIVGVIVEEVVMIGTEGHPPHITDVMITEEEQDLGLIHHVSVRCKTSKLGTITSIVFEQGSLDMTEDIISNYVSM